jgi:hypothetical protein
MKKRLLTKPYDIPKVAQPIVHAPPKPLKAIPHPQQARLEQHRELASLVTDANKNPIREFNHEMECGK